jgi:hypothetical protein
MFRFLITICSLAFFCMVTGGPLTAWAKSKPHKVKVVRTEWTVVSGVPGVEHTILAGKDVFRHHNRYYCYDGRWHQSDQAGGPWLAIPAPPPVLYRVDTVYFKKAPPGWCKGKKTGWRGEPLPPGQMKKLY